jgi:outer membrane protein TolC
MPKPVPLQKADLALTNLTDSHAIGAEPLSGPLSLEQAMARALKFNLERRTHLMEEALALKMLDASRYDMLPKMLVDAGYLSRDSDMIRQSTNAITGAQSPSQFISQERDHGVADLGISWSLLDLGMGYFNAQQQADRVLVAVEKRRRAMHLLLQDVRTAYLRAASAQKLRSEVTETIKLAEAALADAHKDEEARVRNPLLSLRYERQLLENLRLLEAVQQELSLAQLELAMLINSPPGQPIEIADLDLPMPDTSVLKTPIEALEEMALEGNAELREQHYNARIARIETHKTIARMFPNLSLGAGLKYDSDRYLVDSSWRDASVQLSYNLISMISAPAQLKLAKAGVALADQRRMAMHAAVIAQVHLARRQLDNAAGQFERAAAIWETDQRITTQTANRVAAEAQTSLDLVSARTAALLSLLRRYQALAQVQTAEARLQATLGVEPKIDSVSDKSLDELAQQLRTSKTLAVALAAAPAVVAAESATP